MKEPTERQFNLEEINEAMQSVDEATREQIIGKLASAVSEKDRVESLAMAHTAMAEYVSVYDWAVEAEGGMDEITEAAIRMIWATSPETLDDDDLHKTISKIAMAHKIGMDCWFDFNNMSGSLPENLSAEESEVLGELRLAYVEASPPDSVDHETKIKWVNENLVKLEDFKECLEIFVVQEAVRPHVYTLKTYLEEQDVEIPESD